MIKQYQLKDGSIRYSYIAYVGIDSLTGKEKRVKKSGFKTQKEARIAESQLLLKVEQEGFFDKPDRITFEEVYKIWLEHYKNTVKASTYARQKAQADLHFEEVYKIWLEHYKNTVKASTYARQKAQADLHIVPVFDACYVDKISLPMCQKQAQEWFKGYKKYANFIGMTKMVLDFAVNLGYIHDNPMKKIIKPRKSSEVDEEEKKKDNFYSREDLQKFLDCVAKEDKEEIACIFRLLAFTDMRKSEVLALRWKDLDFFTSRLSVNQIVAYGENNSIVYQTPKTKKSKRTITLDPITVSILKKWEKTRQFLNFPQRVKPTDLVFPAETGNAHSFDYINYNLRCILKKYDLPYITPHGFRHTHCSLLFEAGASIKEVQERLGHEDIKTTMNIYAHVTENTKEKTAEKFAQFLGM
ncbi:TPA: site-specific integrase [Streptococcus suis]|nr:site-specific integrase [Streptococcus suis]